MDKRHVISVRSGLLALILLLGAGSVCGVSAEEARILIVGDSWATGILVFKAFPNVFDEHGLENVGVVGAATALGGSRAEQWANNHKGKLDALDKALAENPTIDIVHLSIGGNDFLKAAMKDNEDVCRQPPEKRKAVWQRIWKDIETLVQHILAQRDNVKVLLNDYDYLDPALMRKTFGLPLPEELGHAQMNEVLVEFAKFKRDKAATIARCGYIQHFGLLHYYYGFPPHFDKHTTRLPGGPPEYDPFAGGNPAFPNSPEAMPDGVHPMPKGYQYIIDRCYTTFYERWLNPEAPGEEVPVEAGDVVEAVR